LKIEIAKTTIKFPDNNMLTKIDASRLKQSKFNEN